MDPNQGGGGNRWAKARLPSRQATPWRPAPPWLQPVSAQETSKTVAMTEPLLCGRPRGRHYSQIEKGTQPTAWDRAQGTWEAVPVGAGHQMTL